MYDEFLNFIFPLAKGAGEIQLAYFRGDDLGIETKSNAYDVVTRADKESEAYIVQAILGRYPGHGILKRSKSGHGDTDFSLRSRVHHMAYEIQKAHRSLFSSSPGLFP